MRCSLTYFYDRPTLVSFSHHRNLFPYVYKVIHPKILKLMGRLLPWPKLHHLMDLSGTLNAEAKRIYETKKKLLELGDGATVKQLEECKDIIGLLSACDTPLLIALNWRFPVRANAVESSDDHLSEEELLGQMAYVRVHS